MVFPSLLKRPVIRILQELGFFLLMSLKRKLDMTIYQRWKDRSKMVFQQDFTQWLIQKLLPISINYRSEEHTSELQSRGHLVCRLLLEKKKLDKKIIQK